MQFKSNFKTFSSIKTDLLVVPYFYTGKSCPKPLKELDDLLNKQITNDIKAELISNKSGQTFRISPNGKSDIKHILFIGYDKENQSLSKIRDLTGDVSRLANNLKATSITFFIDEKLSNQEPELITKVIAEGLIMGRYQFVGLKTDLPTVTPLKSFSVLSSANTDDLEDGFTRGLIVGESVNLARNLANTPANLMTPSDVIETAKDLFKGSSVKVSVIDKSKAEKLGMNSFLSVAKGSTEAPYLLILEYQGASKTDQPIAFVGKGVTFDSGGISIKPSGKMSEMKADMSGAASVVGAFNAISQLEPEENIVGVVPLVENMPAGNALKPGDVITAMNKKTIEVLNTDAEGRLILADAITYAVQKLKAHTVVDIATLTGASLIALGELAIALFSNSEKLIKKFKENEALTGEYVWNMPLYDEFKDYLKSDVADIANCYEGRYGGVCTAAKFLEQFIEGADWVHLDIAPLMSSSKTKGAQVKGMRGAATQTLIELVS